MSKTLKTLIATAMLSIPAEALMINNYSPDRHNITSENFFKGEYDMSGIGYNGRWATAISDNWAVTATHYPAGGTMRFPVTGDTAQIVERRNLGDDISLVRFAESLPESIKRYSLFDDEGKMEDWKTELLTVGKDFSAGIIGLQSQPIYLYNCWFWTNKPDWAYSVPGDSGGPTFFQGEDELFLLGTHYSAYRDTNLILNAQRISDITGASISTYQDAMNPIIPEPTTITLLGLGLTQLNKRRKR